MKNRIYLPLSLCVVMLGAVTLSCRKQSSNAKKYEVVGKVVAIDADKHLVTLAHEDIKGYMPAMTMPFAVKDDYYYSILRPGDQVGADLVVDGTDYWLENLNIRQENPDVAPTATNVPAEAKAGDELPNFGLVNQDSKPIKLHNYRGQVLLITFIYTRCPMPDQCTLMSENFARINDELKKLPAMTGKVHLLSVSFDPDYDTPAVLRSYGAAHSGLYSAEDFQHWEFATGTKDQVKGLAQYFGLRYFEGNDQIIHGLRTAVIGPDGKVHKVYRGNDWKPEEAINEVKKIVPEQP